MLLAPSSWILCSVSLCWFDSPAVVKIDGSDMVVNARLGDRAILKCVAHGIPRPRISWSKGSLAFIGRGNISWGCENVGVLPLEEAR